MLYVERLLIRESLYTHYMVFERYDKALKTVVVHGQTYIGSQQS